MWHEVFPSLSFPVDSYPYSAWQTRPVAPSAAQERAHEVGENFRIVSETLPRLGAEEISARPAAGALTLPGYKAENANV